jgi:O-antigen ligase
VHHIYLLTLAELGYVGLLLFLLVMLRFTWRAGREGLFPRSTDAMLARGLFLGLCALHAAGLLEWAFRTTPVMYMAAIVCACIVAFTTRTARRTGRTALSIPNPVSA